ncbi:hypothetical protein HMF8227_01590 [Saliniradius amylolyticus]|uniref:DUF962 domain-containing protein n=1 Tax=Saliniradius amylolyticus TaxID=2183582 RepID=A0A2S2E346_9ALTE|nr:Mpo1-like protein [Saliniradius amylolyticus]AWL12064.1 hypothetical protein HMF8227_01590 [Saliniradius amylolyticus]
MRRIDKLLAEYGDSHTNKTNVMIHFVAVPSIYFVTLGLVWSIPAPQWLAQFGANWAHVVLIPVLFYYFRLSGPIGAAMTLLSAISWVAIELLVYFNISVWQFCLALFVIMWILQFVGHKIEGKKPSFFKDLQFLLVGPAWWWCHFLKRLNISY